MKDVERIKYEEAIKALEKERETKDALLSELYDVQVEIKHREKLLRSLNETAAMLIANETDQPMDALRKCMEMIGGYVEIDRINIWKRIEADGKVRYYRDLGWESESIRKTFPLEKVMLTFPFLEYNQDWYDALNNGVVVNKIASDLPESVYSYLKAAGVCSILLAPVHIQGVYWGFVSYDDCHDASLYSDEESEILRSSSLIMASALMRNEMTEQLIQAREEAMLSAKAKSDFLANMSHEIRTPLNAVIGMTSIGKNARSAERKDYCFGKIEDASKHLLGVINDVLDMSKIEANKLELSEVVFNFEKVLQNLVTVAAFRIEEKKQHFMVYVDEAIPELLIGDDQRLLQVITNLLSNAVKFTPEGGSISIDTKLVSEKDGIYTIRIEVRDTGIGISQEHQATLFTSFQQAGTDTTRQFGGTGLGLAISKRIVELMDGTIWIESEVGKGSSFIFTVKLRQVNEREKRRRLNEGVTLKNLRVLFVDDDADVCEYFEDIAARFGFECDLADSGEQALELIGGNKPYDIFFVDWKMPGMDGLELSKRIRAAGGAKAIITMISAYELAEIEDQARDAGVDRFLSKPLFPSTIVDLITESLGTETANGIHERRPEVYDNFEGARILLAEDVEINREIVLALLEPMSLIIDCAEDGAQAFDMYRGSPFVYDLILMDVQMPHMDGCEAARQIRSLDFEQAQNIPIIAMTANVFKEDVEKCLEAGMDAHLGKPLDFDEIVAMLCKYLRKR